MTRVALADSTACVTRRPGRGEEKEVYLHPTKHSGGIERTTPIAEKRHHISPSTMRRNSTPNDPNHVAVISWSTTPHVLMLNTATSY